MPCKCAQLLNGHTPTAVALPFGWWRTTKRSGLLDAVWEESCWSFGRIWQDGFQKYIIGIHVNPLGIQCNLEARDDECPD